MLNIVGSRAARGIVMSELSVGERQLIRDRQGAAFDAKILFMDEPTSSLSEEVAQNLLSLMSELRAQGMAIVFTTHRLREAFKVAGRLVVLRDGRLVGALLAKNTSGPRSSR